MNPLITGNLKSKTSWTATALIVLGSVQQYFPEFIDLIPEKHRGHAIAVVGFLMLLLRNVSNDSITEKGTPDA